MGKRFVVLGTVEYKRPELRVIAVFSVRLLEVGPCDGFGGSPNGGEQRPASPFPTLASEQRDLGTWPRRGPSEVVSVEWLEAVEARDDASISIRRLVAAGSLERIDQTREGLVVDGRYDLDGTAEI